MEILNTKMNGEPQIYKTGNAWQQTVYAHMAKFLVKEGVGTFGESANGNKYKHLLVEKNSELNFMNSIIYSATRERFSKHKAGDLKRILTNTAASQPYCFNLFVPLNENKSTANSLFSQLFEKDVFVQYIEIEFTPNKLVAVPGFEMSEKDESIGDQGPFSGTDADIAVFYTFENNQKGVLLIEFKFIEAEFSVCSSFKEKNDNRPICNSPNFYPTMVLNKQKGVNNSFLCGYNKFKNWELTKNSKAIDIERLLSSKGCPFRFGLNQLWRNMLLAEKVSQVRNCDEFGFWVLSPKGNDKYLWKTDDNDTENQFRQILTLKGNQSFKKIHLETIFEKLDVMLRNDSDKEWLLKMKEKYLIEF